MNPNKEVVCLCPVSGHAVTAPAIAPCLSAGVSGLGGVAEWMHGKHHIRSDLKNRKGKGAFAESVACEAGGRIAGRDRSPQRSGGEEPPSSREFHI
jgi:hypothetical protein